MRTEQMPLMLCNALVCLFLSGCVAGSARVAPPTSSSSSAATVASPEVGPEATPDAAPVIAAVDGPEFLPGSSDDASVPPASPYDAEESDAQPAVAAPPDTAPSWWPAAFVPGTLPDPANGRGSHAGSNACGNCHKSGGAASDDVWLLGGIVYDSAGGSTPVPSAEIGIKDGANFFQTYSASNGYFWLPSSAGPIDWTTAEIRIRTAQGELKMLTPPPNGDCQTCHTAGNRIYSKP